MNFIFKLIALVILFLPPGNSLAQLESNFKPSPFLDSIPELTSKRLKRHIAETKEAYSDKDHKKFSNALLEKHNQSLVDFYNNDLIISEGQCYSYLKEVLNKIVSKNQTFKNNVFIYPYRSDEPNAITFWDGTIVISLGLLARLKTEDELASVICHELAHVYSNHVLKRINDLTRINYDREIGNEIKNAEKSKFLKYSKLKKIMENLDMSLKYHIREEEFDADSIGLVYFLNTDYRPPYSVRVMEVLDSANSPLFNEEINVKEIFNTKEYPFNDRWLTFEKPKYKSIKEIPDTVLTHPDCKKRIQAINKLLESRGVSVNLNESSTTPNKVFTESKFELIESLFHFKEYGKCLYLSSIMINEFPNNVYLVSMIGRNMAYIYKSMKNLTFGKSVQLVNLRYDEKYNRFLTFLHQLRPSDASALSFYYLLNKKELFYEDENFLFSFWAACNSPVSNYSAQIVKRDYLNLFPNGKFRNLILNNF